MMKQWLVSLAEPFYLNVFMPWFEKNGFILYGGGSKGGSSGKTRINGQVLDMARKGTFKPFTITTSAGEGFGTEGEEGEFGATSSDQFANLQQQSLAGANQLTPQLLQALGRNPSQFQFNNDLDGATQNYFNQQSALLDPMFQQQRTQMQQDMFGSGRLGLQLAGGSVGAGGGMVNPDAFGLARAQSQTLADVAAQSRQMAMGEQQQQFGLESSLFGINDQSQQQYLQNLMMGQQGLFGLGQGVSAQELELFKAGLLGEQLRGSSYADAAGALAAGQTEKQSSGKGNALIGAAANVGSAAIGASDRRLKDNIDFVSEGSNGIKWYTWDWNDKAREIGADINNVEFGVIAQEVMEIYPEAVIMSPDGYYRVNYTMLEVNLKGVA